MPVSQLGASEGPIIGVAEFTGRDPRHVIQSPDAQTTEGQKLQDAVHHPTRVELVEPPDPEAEERNNRQQQRRGTS